MGKRFNSAVAGILGLLALLTSAPAYAAPNPTVSYDVGVCDPYAGKNCIRPLANGSINVNGSFSASLGAFSPLGNAVLNATSTTSNVALPTLDNTVLVQNTGANDAYVNFGPTSAVTATTSNTLVRAGQSVALAQTGNTYIAGIAPGGATAIQITTGTGLPAIANAGGSGGGGSLSATAAAGSIPVTAGAGKPLAIDLFSSMRSIQMDSSGNYVSIATAGNQATQTTALNQIHTDLIAPIPASILSAAPTYTTGTTNAVTADTKGALRILPMDANGTPMTDTVNHALQVNVVAGASSGAVAQGSTTSGQTGGLNQSAATTAAPTYTTGTTNPLSTDVKGALRILPMDGTGASMTDNTNHALQVNVVAGASSGAVAQGSTTSGQTGGLTQAAALTAAPTYTTATTNPLNTDVHGALRVLNMDSTGAAIDPNAALPAGTNVIGKVSQVDSSGADATDTTNHAVKVNIVAGASSGAVAQGSTTAGQTGGLTQGAVTTAAPTYTTAQTNPISLTTAGDLRVVDNTSATTLSAINTAMSTATPTGANNIGSVGQAQGSTTSGQFNQLVGGAVTTSSPTYTTAQTSPLSLDTSGNLRVITTGAATSANQPTPIAAAGQTTTATTGTTMFGAATTSAPTDTTGSSYPLSLTTAGGLRTDLSGTTVPLPTGAATSALQPTNVAIASTTSGQTGHLMQGAVTTAAPAYTTAQSDPLSLTTAGALRGDINSIGSTTVVTGGVAGTLAIGGTVAANVAATGNPVPVGGTYNTSITAATTGQRTLLATDQFGSIRTSTLPAMATVVTAQSATTANTANVATLPAVAAKFTYINGFTCTAGGATAGSLVTITVAGTVTGSLTYTWAIPTGATLAATPFQIEFPQPIPSSAVNTAITVTAGAAGAGSTVQQCNAHGYQQ